MPAQEQTDKNTQQTLHLSAAVNNLRSAEQSLDDVIATTGDPDVLQELTAEYKILNDLVTSLVQAQTIADDGAFQTASKGLNAQATTLKAQEAHIKTIITDVATAAKVMGYIAQAVTFIEAL